MFYDPIKYSLGKFFGQSVFLRRLFYSFLDLLLLRTWHIKRELKVWKKTKPKNCSVLDAGSGFGQYVYFMSRLFPYWKVKGIDIKPEQVADCNSFFKKINKQDSVNFEVADLLSFKEKEQFELILCVDVLEHIEEDRNVMKNFYQSLKVGGMLLISTPSDQGGSDVHEEHNTSFIDEHVRDGYNINEIKEKLKTTGFKNVKIKYSYGPPGKFSWKLSMKYPLILLNISKLFFIVLPFYYLVLSPFLLFLNYIDIYKFHKTGTGLIVKAYK